MTKSEYREEYGRYDACRCTQCEEFFPCSELNSVIEPHGEETPVCPNCGCDDIEYDVFIEEEEGE